jgi:hypothetical protein
MKGGVFRTVLGLLVALVLWFLVSSCSSWRIREKQNFSQQVESHQLELDSLEMKWNVERHRVQFSHSDQQVVIWPTGEFRFDLDSGYRGEAVVVEISRKGVDSVVELEESFGEMVVSSQMEENQEESLEEDFEFSEGERGVMLKCKWIWYLSGAGLLIFGLKGCMLEKILGESWVLNGMF